MTKATNQDPPVIAWCSEVQKSMRDHTERFFILSMEKGEREIVSFHISETEARESYGIRFGKNECPCRQLAVELYNGFFSELKLRRHG